MQFCHILMFFVLHSKLHTKLVILGYIPFRCSVSHPAMYCVYLCVLKEMISLIMSLAPFLFYIGSDESIFASKYQQRGVRSGNHFLYVSVYQIL